MIGDAFFKTREETQDWLDKMGVVKYTINNDLTVDVNTKVDISGKGLTHIPVQFGVVGGYFTCSNNDLTSLKGAPRECSMFWCDGNQLANLEGAPNTCWNFYCSDNALTTLDGAPETCDSLQCTGNPALVDISAAPDGCEVRYDHDVVTRNQAARQLANLDTDNGNPIVGTPGRNGRIL